jgi:nicotinate-nucleotide--dimethylbenzimidazole phosphoribosyltransferase
MKGKLLRETVAAVAPVDGSAAAAARVRLDSLTKPPGSLGRLEEIAQRVAAITGNPRPVLRRKVVYTLASDHGVAAEGVSAYPQSVTLQMVRNFLSGGAAINVLARHVGAEVSFADFGVAVDPGPLPGLLSRRIGAGTANMRRGPAMTRGQAEASVEAGIRLVDGADIVATGDMGIGNTTAASAVTAAVTGRPAGDVTGMGTGIGRGALSEKVRIVGEALAVNRPNRSDGLDVLAKVGGFEIGGLAGVMIGAAAGKIPVVLDGFISGAAALIAVSICPRVRDYLIAGHRSAEPGHEACLAWLDLAPVLTLGMRLGEGTGAVLAMSVVEAALRVLDEMATFGEAGVAGNVPSAPLPGTTGSGS